MGRRERNYGRETFWVGWSAAQWLSTVIGEAWSVGRVPVHVCEEEYPVGGRTRLWERKSRRDVRKEKLKHYNE